MSEDPKGRARALIYYGRDLRWIIGLAKRRGFTLSIEPDNDGGVRLSFEDDQPP